MLHTTYWSSSAFSCNLAQGFLKRVDLTPRSEDFSGAQNQNVVEMQGLADPKVVLPALPRSHHYDATAISQ
jgi:hypothetical protein